MAGDSTVAGNGTTGSADSSGGIQAGFQELIATTNQNAALKLELQAEYKDKTRYATGTTAIS
jgi:hypothetical protein